MRFAYLLTAVVTAMLGCSEKHPQTPPPQAGGVIPQAQLDALNKAKNVQNLIQQDEQQRREQSDAAQ